jgi:DNA-binding LacI/PurR family transcriptional regulator
MPIDDNRLPIYNLYHGKRLSLHIIYSLREIMTKKISIKDIAKYVGVAPSTVSRVLNNASFAYPVSEKTRNKIFAAVKELNYTPNINARRLSQSRSYTLGLVVPSSENIDEEYYVFNDISFNLAMKGVEEYLRKSEYRLLLIFKDRKYIESKEYIRLFEEKHIDGMLTWGAMLDDCYLKELYKYPLVQLNSSFRHDNNAYTVEIDNLQGSYQVADYLLRQGKRKILYIEGKKDVSISHDHKQGYLKALSAYDLSLDEQLIIQGDFRRHCGYDLVIKAIEAKVEFDAVQCINDDIANECCRALEEKGLIPGADILVGGGHRSHVRFLPNNDRIVSYYVDYCQMGRQALHILQQLIQGKKPAHLNSKIKIELIT